MNTHHHPTTASREATQSTPGTGTQRAPRRVLISAWAVPVMVIGQFSFLAVVPVAIVVVFALRNLRDGALRRWALGLGAVYAVPMAVWILRPDRAPSLSKDMSPVLAGLIVVVACGLALAAHRSRRTGATS